MDLFPFTRWAGARMPPGIEALFSATMRRTAKRRSNRGQAFLVNTEKLLRIFKNLKLSRVAGALPAGGASSPSLSASTRSLPTSCAQRARAHPTR
eukprot:779566-Pyramimonas_sp.AAC.1